MIPRRTFLALMLAVAAPFLALSRTTFAATSSTQPSTRPAASGETAELIRRLSSGSWKERQAAQARLVQLAEQARPQLEALLNPEPGTPALDDESRNRVVAAL